MVWNRHVYFPISFIGIKSHNLFPILLHTLLAECNIMTFHFLVILRTYIHRIKWGKVRHAHAATRSIIRRNFIRYFWKVANASWKIEVIITLTRFWLLVLFALYICKYICIFRHPKAWIKSHRKNGVWWNINNKLDDGKWIMLNCSLVVVVVVDK